MVILLLQEMKDENMFLDEFFAGLYVMALKSWMLRKDFLMGKPFKL